MKNLKRYLVIRPVFGGDDTTVEYVIPQYESTLEMAQDMTESEIVDIVNKALSERIRCNARAEALYNFRRNQ